VIDHRPAQTPVRHQGNRPTCVAFAVSAAHEWHAGDGVVRSSEDAMWAAHQVNEVAGREETTISWALEGLDRHQHSTEAAWPYGVPPWVSGRPAAALASANRRPLPMWHDLGAASFDRVSDELDAGRPVVLTLRVVAAAWYHAGDLVDAEANLKAPGNHAVLAVGALDGLDRLIIKNSWGPAWGDVGYGYVTRRYHDFYALRAHTLEAP
jgi:hypothetical protein